MRRRVYRTRRTYQPAYHRPRRARRRLRLPVSVKLYALAMLLASGIWWVNQWPWLRLSSIEVVGNRTVSREAIAALINAQLDAPRFGVMPQRNFLWFDADSAVEALQQQFGFPAVEVARRWPNTVTVTVHEPTATLVWVSGTQGYYVDDGGRAIAPVSSDDALSLQQGSVRVLRHPAVARPIPVVYDPSNQPPVLGQPVALPSALAYLLDLNDRLSGSSAIPISHYQWDGNERKLVAVTQRGWQIIFSLDRGAGEQLASLAAVFEASIKDQSKLKYIDLRFGGKVYYR